MKKLPLPRVFPLILAVALWLLPVPNAVAIMANPKPFECIQPDGAKITLRLRGDEFFHWYEDLEGFTVVYDGKRFVYARLDNQQYLQPTSWVVGQINPRNAGLKPHQLPPPELRPANLNDDLPLYRPWLTQPKGGISPQIVPSGTVKNLVILCMFSDHTNGLYTRAQADYDVLFNQTGGDPVLAPTGSVKDAYKENSYGILTLDSTVVAWVTLPQTESYYADGHSGMGSYPRNAQKMVEDALALADPIVDFGQFDMDNDGYVDAIDIIHSGYGAEHGGQTNKIWSHQWYLPTAWVSGDTNGIGVHVKVINYHTESAFGEVSGTNITHINVICHETGHFFGLPDLYDTDYSSSGIGGWCLMAYAWGFDGSLLYPPHLSAWCKARLGWMNPTELTSFGSYSVTQAETSNSLFKITRGFPPNEYLLIENRQPVGLDAKIPHGGLAIWHIDENKPSNNQEGFPGLPGWPENNKHYKVALLQADGQYDLESSSGSNIGDAGDLYYGGAVSEIGFSTIPNTHAYQGGVIVPTFIRISGISTSASTMNFTFDDGLRIYIDCNYLGQDSDGTVLRPFRTVTDGHTAARNGDILVIEACNYPEALTMGKNLRVWAKDGVVTIGR